jgi:membrane-associated progesterone receptor component
MRFPPPPLRGHQDFLPLFLNFSQFFKECCISLPRLKSADIVEMENQRTSAFSTLAWWGCSTVVLAAVATADSIADSEDYVVDDTVAEESSWLEIGAMGILLGVIGWLLKELLFPGAVAQPPVASIASRKRTPVEPRDFSPEELRKMNGTNGNPVYVAVLGVVYDVSSRASFYGPGGPYHIFAGRDAARALALGSLEEKDVEAPYPKLDDLQPSEREALNDWIGSYQAKYEVVGRIIPSANSIASSPSD